MEVSTYRYKWFVDRSGDITIPCREHIVHLTEGDLEDMMEAIEDYNEGVDNATDMDRES